MSYKEKISGIGNCFQCGNKILISGLDGFFCQTCQWVKVPDFYENEPTNLN
ncbi:MAG: hypothetical protein RLZZ338_625 [Cyanobacteriota bacterium]|jgi:peroxiredoxin